MKFVKYLLPVLGVYLFFLSQDASALPVFARQTELPCSSCHNGNYLALNSFGRNFKLKGYTLTTGKKLTQKDTDDNRTSLSLPELPGLSAMVQVSLTHTNKGIAGKQNDDIRLPQQLSLFLAGRLSDHMGIFSQFTYANGDSGFAMDNTDLRYASSTTMGNKSLDYGFTLDNNPTVGDLWNSTPAWGFPYSSSDIANGPAAGSFISSLGGAVGGLGAYAMLDNHYYGKIALYRNTNTNGVAAANNVLESTAPYWRFAWQTNFDKGYLMLGTYGISASVYPTATSTSSGIGGPTSKYLDTAIDFQYERPLSGSNSIVVHGSYTDESRTDLSSTGTYLAGNSPKWKFTNLDLEYNVDGRWRHGVQLFNTNTGGDNLDTNGYKLDVGYFPWQNIELQVQYTAYNKFDGATSSASDNNSIFFMFWIVM